MRSHGFWNERSKTTPRNPKDQEKIDVAHK